MIVAIASGKGGTGKTTVSTNLASVLGFPLQLLDCDVEEPNDHLFIPGVLVKSEAVTVPIPQVDERLCDSCGECSRFCAYHAIVALKKPLVFPELCHSCGGCLQVCPRHAIAEIDRTIGTVEIWESGDITLVQGRLNVGVAMSPPLIHAVKDFLRSGVPAILDAPPGTSCPVIASLRGSDFVLLVTEPTPFGLHDLKLAVEMVARLEIPFGIVVNRMGIGDDRVHRFCRDREIPVLLDIPDDRRVAELYSRGILASQALPEYRDCFRDLWEKIAQFTKEKKK